MQTSVSFPFQAELEEEEYGSAGKVRKICKLDFTRLETKKMSFFCLFRSVMSSSTLKQSFIAETMLHLHSATTFSTLKQIFIAENHRSH